MDRILIYAIAIYILYQVWKYVYIIYSFWSIPLKRSTYSFEEKLPNELEYLIEIPRQKLLELGFTDPWPVLANGTSFDQRWQMLYRHHTETAFALVELISIIDVVMPISVTFYSVTKNSFFITTVNGKKHLIFGTPPNEILQDFYTSDLAEQWKRHQESLDSFEGELERFPTLSFLDALQTHNDADFQNLIDTKKLGNANSESFHYPTLAGAFEISRNYRKGAKKLNSLRQQMLANIKEGNAPLIDIPITLEARSFQVMSELKRRKLNRQWKLWAVLITLGLFLISFSQLMEFRFVLMLLGVLFLHEGGHWVAMSLTGYKDLSLFFIPFLGAAVTGKKRQEVVGERMLVLLAGPLPGLILGLGMRWGLMDTAVPLWIHELSLMLIIINILNLLPLHPLDGGQIVNMLLFSQRPYADVVFKLLAMLTFGAAAVWLKDPILGFLTVIVALSIRNGFRFARVFKHIDYSELSNDDEDGRVRASFQAIKDAGYNQLPFGHKFQLVKGLINRSWQKSAGRGQRLLLIAIYALILVGGFVLSALTLFPRLR